jgi:DNA-binding MarR family transcriptional regulator
MREACVAEKRRVEQVSKAEYETLAAFRYALRRFLSFSEEKIKSVGLTPRQHQGLLAIKGFPGRESITVGELAERLQVRHHSAVGLANRLAAQGLVERVPAEGDKRRVMLALTPRGSEVLEQLAIIHRDELRRIGPELTAAITRLWTNEP